MQIQPNSSTKPFAGDQPIPSPQLGEVSLGVKKTADQVTKVQTAQPNFGHTIEMPSALDRQIKHIDQPTGGFFDWLIRFFSSLFSCFFNDKTEEEDFGVKTDNRENLVNSARQVNAQIPTISIAQHEEVVMKLTMECSDLTDQIAQLKAKQAQMEAQLQAQKNVVPAVEKPATPSNLVPLSGIPTLEEEIAKRQALNAAKADAQKTVLANASPTPISAEPNNQPLAAIPEAQPKAAIPDAGVAQPVSNATIDLLPAQPVVLKASPAASPKASPKEPHKMSPIGWPHYSPKAPSIYGTASTSPVSGNSPPDSPVSAANAAKTSTGRLASFMSRFSKVSLDDRPNGIANLGTTCYINSSLQVLMALKPIIDALRQPIEQTQRISQAKIAELHLRGTVALEEYIQGFVAKKSNSELEDLRQQLQNITLENTPETVERFASLLTEKVNAHPSLSMSDAATIVGKLQSQVAIVNRRPKELSEREELRKEVESFIDVVRKGSTLNDVKDQAHKLLWALFSNKESRFAAFADDIYEQHDPAMFVETVLNNVLGFAHQVQIKRTATVNAGETFGGVKLKEPLEVVRYVTEPEVLLSLGVDNIDKDVPINLQELWDGHFAPTLQKTTWTPKKLKPDLDGEVGIVNPGDTFAKCYESRKILQNLQGMVVVQIKRFRDDGSKVSNALEFPKTFDLSAAVDKKPNSVKGELMGFVAHSGSRIQSGHCTSYVKMKNQWYYCNDSSVRAADEAEVEIARREAYILFFEPKEM